MAVHVTVEAAPRLAVCDVTTDGGGWLLLQVGAAGVAVVVVVVDVVVNVVVVDVAVVDNVVVFVAVVLELSGAPLTSLPTLSATRKM